VKYLRDEKALKAIGLNIQKLRKEQKVSQTQLAFEAGVPLRQLLRIEKGEVNTGISTLIAIARALDVQVKDVVNF
jgi:transcriptional regulator with XRE-family HTH domain